VANPYLNENPYIEAKPSNPYLASGNPYLAQPDEEKGFISTALDYLDKPASAIAGAVEYLAGQSGQDNILSAAYEGARKNTDYAKVLQQAGIDPESLGGKVANIGGKILLDPLWVVKPVTVAGKIAQGSRAIGLTDKIADATKAVRESKVGQTVTDLAEQAGNKEIGGLSVKRWFTEESPIQAELDKLERASIASADEIRAGTQKIEDLRKIHPDLPKEVTRAQEARVSTEQAADGISDLTKQQVYDEIAQKYSPEAAKGVRETVEFINDISTRGTRGLYERGIISQETMEKFTDRYIRREYSKYVTPDEHLQMLRETGQLDEAAKFENGLNAINRGAGKYGLDLKKIKQRQDLPPEIQEKLGRLMDATHPFAKGGKITADLINRFDFLQDVSKYASDTAQVGYKLIEGAKFGPLNGKYLPRDIANEINRVVPQMTDPAKFWQKAVGWWKMGKTVLSPATFMRNNMSNLVLLNIAGVPTYDIPQYMFRAGNELLEKGKFVELAKKSGTFLSNTLTETELRKFLEKGAGQGVLEKGVNLVKDVTGKAADIYQGSEKLGKMAAFMWAIEKGKMAPEAAAKFADEALFNYSKVPPIIDSLRKNGLVPFATFPYKATQMTAKALYENPARVAGYYKPIRASQDPDEQKILPDYLNPETLLNVGKGTRMVNGKPQQVTNYLDAQNILPFQSAENLGISPAFTIASALYSNRNPLTGQEIARLGQTGTERAGARAKYVAQQVLPANPLIPGTYGYDKLINQGVLGEPDYKGRQYGLKEAVGATILGVKNTPINTIEAGRSRVRDIQKELQAVQYEIKSVQQDARLPAEAKKERIAEYQRKRQELAKELQAVGQALQRLNKKEGR
jgi:hypothetical protein